MTQERAKTIQTAVRLPSEVHDRLRQSELGVSEEIRRALERVQTQDAIAPLVEAAAKNGRTVAAEIEQRIRRTLAEDALDPVTRELVAGIVNLAATMEAFLDAGRWHWHQQLHGIFAAATAQRLTAYKPPTEGALALQRVAQTLGDAAASQLEQAPDALGGVIERADRRTHSYEYLQRFQRLQEARPPPAPHSHLRKEEDKD